MGGVTHWGLVGLLDGARPPLAWPHRLLVVGPAGLGDTVLALPALRRIQAASPATQITWVARRAFAPLLAMAGVARYVAGEDLRGGAPASDGFDALLSLADAVAETVGGLVRVDTVPLRIGPAAARSRPRLWNHVVHTSRLGQPRHEAQRHLRMLLPFGAGAPASADELHRGARLRATGVALPQDLPVREHVVLHPYSMGHAREWPVAHWVALARELAAADRVAVFTGSAAEGERFAVAWPASARPSQVRDAFGRLDLEQLATLLARADAVVACSTGPLHLAAALGTPTLGLYVPRRGLGVDRWAALGSAALSVQLRPGCRRRCDNASCACMAAIAPARVAQALHRGPRQLPDAAALAGWHLAPLPARPAPSTEPS